MSYRKPIQEGAQEHIEKGEGPLSLQGFLSFYIHCNNRGVQATTSTARLSLIAEQAGRLHHLTDTGTVNLFILGIAAEITHIEHDFDNIGMVPVQT